MVTILSALHIEKGQFIFEGENSNRQILVDAFDVSANHSRVAFHNLTKEGIGNFTLFKDIYNWINTINDNSITAMARNVVLLSVINELIQKPRIYHFLQIGKWSPFSNCLAEVLRKFNDNNRLYYLTDDKASQELKNVSFISTENGKFLLPESKFSAVFFDEVDKIYLRTLDNVSKDIILSIKDGGKLFFFTFPNFVSQLSFKESKEFNMHKSFSLASVCITSELKNKFHQQTLQGKVAQEKQKIVKSLDELSENINKLEFLPVSEQVIFLDRLINQVYKAEKIISKIYSELNSMYIKSYFNELKESLIDYRLQIEGKFHKSYFEKILEIYRLVLHEIKIKDDFVLG